MLTPSDNQRITRVGPGTPMGATLRRYWMPACLSEELPEPDGAPIRVRLLGEDLIAFRDTSGAVGLVSAFCPHRRAPLFFGRNEEGGLRCVYHGWKFDRGGSCVDLPSEPPDSLFKSKVNLEAYPAWEGGGIVWAYLGPPDHRPAPPDFELCRVPATHRYATKTHQACNWLQGVEGAVDSVHSGMLHNDDISDTQLLRNKRCEVEFDLTPYGLGGAAIHPLEGDRIYARTFHFILPIHSVRGRVHNRRGVPEPIPSVTGQVFAPIDDENCWLYSYEHAYDPAIAIDASFVAERAKLRGRDTNDAASPYYLRATMANDYLIDRKLQRERSYSGLLGMNVQDIALQEGMGPICDRSREHLAHSDHVIVATRRLLLDAMAAVERGADPLALDPAAYRDVRGTDHIVPAGTDWRTAYKELLVARF
jgi:phthalate 4,5-dioxygenase oxygenase subunit